MRTQANDTSRRVVRVQTAARRGRGWLWQWISLISVLSLLMIAADARPVDPLGVQFYDYQSAGQVNTGSAHSISFNFDKNQVISILMEPVNPFLGDLTLRLGSVTVATVSATAVGETLLLQSIPITTAASNYSVEIRSRDVGAPAGTKYDYQLTIVSAALEAETYTIPDQNNSIAGAENINASVVTYDEGVLRGAVYGKLRNAADIDVFSFRLNGGEHFELLLARLGAAGMQVELLDSGGIPLAIVPEASVNGDLLLTYEVPTSGLYYARVSGAAAANVPYGLVLLRGAALSREPNASFESAQVITGLRGVLGSVSVPPMDGTLLGYTFNNVPMQVGFLPSGAFYQDINGINSGVGLRLNSVEYLGQGVGQFASFTYCYGEGAGRVCPVHQNHLSSGGVTPVLSHKQTLAGDHYFIVEGRTSQLHFVRVLQWHKSSSRFVVTTQLTNLGTVALNGLQALESINPNPAGNANTNNDVNPGGSLPRTAQAWNENGAVVLGTSDPRATAGFVTGDIADPAVVFAKTAQELDPDGASSNEALHLAFNLGSIPAGERADFTFVLSLGASAEAALSGYQAAQPEHRIMGLDNLYAIDLQAGRKVVLSTLLPLRENLAIYRNNLDPVLKLYGPDRSLLAVNDDCAPEAHCLGQTIEAQLEYIPTQDGRYYIQVTNSSKTSLYGPSQTMSTRAGGEFVLLVFESSPPVMNAIDDQEVNLGDELVVRVIATDPDLQQGDRLTYHMGPGAPAGAVIDPISGFMQWTPTQSGDFVITLMVEDRAWLQDSQTFNVHVVPGVEWVYLPVVRGNEGQ